jgi:hypothetical protein
MTAVAEERRLLRVLELTGPAGIGKSTLSSVLVPRMSAVPRTIWGQPPLSLLGTGVQLAPTLLKFCHSSGSLPWAETRHIVRLSALYRSLSRAPRSGEPALLFDEGPVFALAWLRGFGHECMRSRVAENWWRVSLGRWSRTIDAVVVLDAPDAVLVGRIRSRPEWHEIKDQPEWYMAEWIGRFRVALEWVLDGLVREGGPAVIRIHVNGDQPQCIADRVASELSRLHDN